MSYMSLWELHRAPDLVALRGQKSMKIAHKRIQDQKQNVLFKIAVNSALTLPADSADRARCTDHFARSGSKIENKNISVVAKH